MKIAKILLVIGVAVISVISLFASVSADIFTVPDDSWCHTFSADLKNGSSGDEVESLQIALNGFLKSNNKSLIVVDGAFGTATENAVFSFQFDKKLDLPASSTAMGPKASPGVIDAATRTELNKLYACKTVAAANPASSSITPPVGSSDIASLIIKLQSQLKELCGKLSLADRIKFPFCDLNSTALQPVTVGAAGSSSIGSTTTAPTANGTESSISLSAVFEGQNIVVQWAAPTASKCRFYTSYDNRTGYDLPNVGRYSFLAGRACGTNLNIDYAIRCFKANEVGLMRQTTNAGIYKKSSINLSLCGASTAPSVPAAGISIDKFDASLSADKKKVTVNWNAKNAGSCRFYMSCDGKALPLQYGSGSGSLVFDISSATGAKSCDYRIRCFEKADGAKMIQSYEGYDRSNYIIVNNPDTTGTITAPLIKNVATSVNDKQIALSWATENVTGSSACRAWFAGTNTTIRNSSSAIFSIPTGISGKSAYKICCFGSDSSYKDGSDCATSGGVLYSGEFTIPAPAPTSASCLKGSVHCGKNGQDMNNLYTCSDASGVYTLYKTCGYGCGMNSNLGAYTCNSAPAPTSASAVITPACNSASCVCGCNSANTACVSPVVRERCSANNLNEWTRFYACPAATTNIEYSTPIMNNSTYPITRTVNNSCTTLWKPSSQGGSMLITPNQTLGNISSADLSRLISALQDLLKKITVSD